MIAQRTVTLADPLARANVVEAFRGPGAPVGILAVEEHDATIAIRFDDAVTAPELVDDLIAIESVFVPERAPAREPDDAAAIAAQGLGDPELDGTRIIERYLDGDR